VKIASLTTYVGLQWSGGVKLWLTIADQFYLNLGGRKQGHLRYKNLIILLGNE
jgi:hypothetical protein